MLNKILRIKAQRVADDIFWNQLFKMVPAEEIDFRRELAREYNMAADEIIDNINIFNNLIRLEIINNLLKD